MVQVCEVRDSKGNILKRPIQYLFPCEIENLLPQEYVEKISSEGGT